MNKLKSLVLISCAVLLMTSCKPTKVDKCTILYEDAENLFLNQSYSQASLLLDSLHTTYPKLINFRYKADTLQWRIERANNIQSYNYLDSILPIMNDSISSLLKDTKYIKTKYEDIGRYIPKNININKSISSNMLYPYCDSMGKRYIQAFTINSNKKSNKISISISNTSIETIPIDALSGRRYLTNGTWYEVLLIDETKLNGVFSTLANSDKQSVLISHNNNISYYLSRKNKRAFSTINSLSYLLKSKSEMIKQKRILQKKIEVVNSRLKTSNQKH